VYEDEFPLVIPQQFIPHFSHQRKLVFKCHAASFLAGILVARPLAGSDGSEEPCRGTGRIPRLIPPRRETDVTLLIQKSPDVDPQSEKPQPSPGLDYSRTSFERPPVQPTGGIGRGPFSGGHKARPYSHWRLWSPTFPLFTVSGSQGIALSISFTKSRNPFRVNSEEWQYSMILRSFSTRQAATAGI